MHGIAKRGLALVAATSGLVLGGAAVATADAGATTTATTSHSGGAVAGWVAQAPVNIPVNVCGNSVEALAFKEMVHGSTCTNKPGAVADAHTDKSGGIGAGNTVQVAGNVPVNVCGNTVAALAVKNEYHGSTCTNNATGPGAVATSSIDHSGGILAGNTVQAALNVPVNACGNVVGLGVVKNDYAGQTCTN
jgi:ChpA-C